MTKLLVENFSFTPDDGTTVYLGKGTLTLRQLFTGGRREVGGNWTDIAEVATMLASGIGMQVCDYGSSEWVDFDESRTLNLDSTYRVA